MLVEKLQLKALINIEMGRIPSPFPTRPSQKAVDARCLAILRKGCGGLLLKSGIQDLVRAWGSRCVFVIGPTSAASLMHARLASAVSAPGSPFPSSGRQRFGAGLITG